MQSVLSAAKGK